MADIANLMPDQRTDERYTPSAVMDMCLAMYRLLQERNDQAWAERTRDWDASRLGAGVLVAHDGSDIEGFGWHTSSAERRYEQAQLELNTAARLMLVRVRDAMRGTRMDVHATLTALPHHGGFNRLLTDEGMQATGNPVELTDARFVRYDPITAELVVQSRNNKFFCVPLFLRDPNAPAGTVGYVQMATILNISRDPVPDELAS